MREEQKKRLRELADSYYKQLSPGKKEEFRRLCRMYLYLQNGQWGNARKYAMLVNRMDIYNARRHEANDQR